jgi:hypothetical protein
LIRLIGLLITFLALGFFLGLISVEYFAGQLGLGGMVGENWWIVAIAGLGLGVEMIWIGD